MGVEGQAMKNGGSHSGLGPSLLLLRAGITQVSRFPFSPSIQGIVSVATADMHPRASHGVAATVPPTVPVVTGGLAWIQYSVPWT